jgi:hypothetical protein
MLSGCQGLWEGWVNKTNTGFLGMEKFSVCYHSNRSVTLYTF